MRFFLKKDQKLRNRFQYRTLAKKRCRLAGERIFLDYLKIDSLENAKLGITVTTKYGKAHLRNRFKRLAREAFRLHQHEIPNIWMNISPKKPFLPLSQKEIEKDILSLIHKITSPSV